MAQPRDTHIHVEFMYRWLPGSVGRSISTCVDAVRIGFLGYATWLTFLLIPKMQNLKMTVIDVPMSYIYGFVAFGFVMMTFRSVQVAVRHWRQGWSVLERPGDAEA
jgi:TRAP-type C4-dicarboxylate transport system permease small subunit